LHNWRPKRKAVADSLEAGDELFALTRLPQNQWNSPRPTNAIARRTGEFRRWIKTQTVLPCAETVPMLLWSQMVSGQIIMRKVDGWETLGQPAFDPSIGQVARAARYSPSPKKPKTDFHHFRDMARLHSRMF